MSEPPAGDEWILVEETGAFTDLIGPIYMRRLGQPEAEREFVRFGFRVQAKHCNPSGNCHGGMLASFLDIALARTGILSRGYEHRTPSISLHMNFLQAARIGEWIESRSCAVHSTRRTGFCEATLVGPRGPVLHGSGIFRIPKQQAA